MPSFTCRHGGHIYGNYCTFSLEKKILPSLVLASYMVYFGLALMFYFDFWTFLSNAKRVCMVCPCKPIAFIKIGKRKAMIWLFFTMQSFSLDLGQMIVLPCLSHSQPAPFFEIWLIWLSPIRAIICKGSCQKRFSGFCLLRVFWQNDCPLRG